ncbi:MAG: AMP-binding protein [Aureispira sp.]|nr:AMP-binding protein [Aureispira sp.]
MFQLLKKLYQIRLLSPIGLFRLLRALWNNGTNLNALLEFAAKTHPNSIALQDEELELDYKTLHQQSQHLALALKINCQLEAKQKVAIICRNHAMLVQSMFAISRLGAHLYLLNVEMNTQQLQELIQRHQFEVIIHDAEVEELLRQVNYQGTQISAYPNGKISIQQLIQTRLSSPKRLKRHSSGNLIILTGGTTGTPKAAARKPSVFTFLNPFFALLTQLNLDHYKTVYIPTPIYHGFGVSAVLVSMVLGAKILVRQRFDTTEACQLIEQEQAEVVTLVPVMLKRMLQQNPKALHSLEVIIAGGAPLSPSLVKTSAGLLGHKLVNLYGTTEAGFSIMATPNDLKTQQNSIGKAIMGVRMKIMGEDNKEVPNGTVGRICIKNKWVMASAKNAWVDTGDCGHLDKDGFCFLSGRVDDMIVSGGENVYPIELENILIQHPAVHEVAVIGIPDSEFGQRLKAFVVLKKEHTPQKEELFVWLKEHAARYQQPAQIEFKTALPYTALGKLNKKILE